MFPTSHFGRRLLRPFVCAAIVFASLVAYASARAQAQWQFDGINASGEATCDSQGPGMCPDGFGGAWLVWIEDHPFIRRVLADGSRVPSVRVRVVQGPDSLRARSFNSMCPDGEGGVYVSWSDSRGTWGAVDTDWDIYLIRYLADGTLAPGWPEGGLAINTALYPQDFSFLLPDGAGGVFIAWQDTKGGLADHDDIFAQRVKADGMLAPGWPAGGVPVCTAPSFSGIVSLCTDGADGFFATWSDTRDAVWNPLPNNGDVYLHHFTASGVPVAGWPVDGMRVIHGDPLPRRAEGIVPDGQGGVYVVWTVLPEGNGTFSDDVHAMRFTSTGTPSPGWSPQGITVAAAAWNQSTRAVAPDGLGGLLITWDDYSAGWARAGLQRIRPDGTIPPGWTPNGTYPTDFFGWNFARDIAPDGMGGAWVTFTELAEVAERGVIQHLSADGVPAAGWPSTGLYLSSSVSDAISPHLAQSVGGSVIAGWEDARERPCLHIFAQRYQGDGPTPAQVSLASLDATAERVRVVWQVSGDGLAAGTIERMSAEESWSAIGSAAFDGSGRLVFEDHAVVAGTRYAYRLRWREGGVEQVSGESWVVMPIALELALEGARPNPSLDGLTVAFTLPGGASATLEAVDASGRVVRTREVGALGAGRHIVRLDEGVRLAPGRYWLRLRQGEAQRVRTAVVIR